MKDSLEDSLENSLKDSLEDSLKDSLKDSLDYSLEDSLEDRSRSYYLLGLEQIKVGNTYQHLGVHLWANLG